MFKYSPHTKLLILCSKKVDFTTSFFFKSIIFKLKARSPIATIELSELRHIPVTLLKSSLNPNSPSSFEIKIYSLSLTQD